MEQNSMTRHTKPLKETYFYKQLGTQWVIVENRNVQGGIAIIVLGINRSSSLHDNKVSSPVQNKKRITPCFDLPSAKISLPLLRGSDSASR